MRLQTTLRSGFLGVLTGAVLVLAGIIMLSPLMAERTETVFVYGTLLRPSARIYACWCLTDVQPATLAGYTKIGRNIIPDSDGVVPGGILRVSPQELARLDRYERVPELYVRTTIEIADETHWVYRLTASLR